MKRALLSFSLLLCGLVTTAQSFELRLHNAGNGVIAVEMRETSGKPPKTADINTDLVFGICWDKNYKIDLGNATSNYTIRKAGPETVSGEIEYQQFAKDPNPMYFPTDWGNGQWVTILTIPNNMASSRALGNFSVCPTNLQELNINYNLVDYPVVTAGNATGVRIGSLMPEGLRLFDANLNGAGQVNLEWQIVSDKNFIRYELEHSADGNTFTRFADVPAKNANTADSRYDYLHSPHPAGANYYRLNMVGANGRTEYSPVRLIQFERKSDLNVTPNPSKGDFAVLLDAAQDEEVLLSVLDSSGKTVYQDVVALQRGPNRHAVRLNEIAAGVYQVSVRWSDNSTQTKNLIISR